MKKDAISNKSEKITPENKVDFSTLDNTLDIECIKAGKHLVLGEKYHVSSDVAEILYKAGLVIIL